MIAVMALFLFPAAVRTAEAGVIDRIKDIYQAPEKVESLEQYYQETTQQLESQLETQRQQLEQSLQRIEELLDRQEQLQSINDSYRQENKTLQEENRQLVERMEQMEQERKAFIRKALWTGAAAVLLLLAYALSVRIWRYTVWRRQGRERNEALLP
ncbi:hypothetical protein IJ21_00450 [Paenibacillus sp. 32O-W]|nr:hypothetical protein IJ21_00450 [Paenibacillus sp. 32O-W]